MVKTKNIFVCQECGTESPRWLGKCPGCDSWNSYVEEKVVKSSERNPGVRYEEAPVLLTEAQSQDEERRLTGMEEFDRVMGGGIVNGSVTLIGGDPGIGKSTLSLQIASALSRRGVKVLYVSGEESIKQTSMRAARLGANTTENLYIVNQVDVQVITTHIQKLAPDVVVIDSIQVVYQPEVASSPGSVSQVRECAAYLTHLAKSRGFSLFMIGHVTKEGMLAGPRVLEHIVDTVLYFEGERYSSYRILRGTKNRFGSTNEIGVYEMTAEGLMEVLNPSEIFLAERPSNTSGSVVVPVMEGTRPFLVEVQGLVSRSSFGVVRQKAQGYDPNRLALLIAVLEKRIGLNLGDKDIFLNIVGGVKVADPAADLAVTTAVASALLDRPVSEDIAMFGEVGLASEVRSVTHVMARISEAQKLGFKRCFVPQNNLRSKTEIDVQGMEILPVRVVQDVLDYIKDH